jgi:hypothetical protein
LRLKIHRKKGAIQIYRYDYKITEGVLNRGNKTKNQGFKSKMIEINPEKEKKEKKRYAGNTALPQPAAKSPRTQSPTAAGMRQCNRSLQSDDNASTVKKCRERKLSY